MGTAAGLEERAAEACRRWSGRDGAGLAAAVVVDGEVVWGGGFGAAVVPGGPALGVDSIGYVGSVAKQFTAAAVVLAALEGELVLDDRVRRWVPELPAHCDDVRLDHLLQHTSGMRDYFGYRALLGRFPDHEYGPDALLADVGVQRRLNCAPGQRFGYSNTNYVLLSMVVERATGVPFAELVRSRIFEPLGMNDSSFQAGVRRASARVARAYDRTADGGWSENDPALGVVGDGGMWSTAADLARWTVACMDGSLDPRLVGLLGERGRLSSGHVLSYGRGLAHRIVAGRRCLRHGGGLGAWRAWVAWFPDDRVGVVVVANAGEVDCVRIAAKLLDPLVPGISADRPSPPVPSALFGLWIDDDQGIVLEISGTGADPAVMAFGGRPLPLSGDDTGAGAVVVDALGARLTVTGPGPDGRVFIDDNGDPWAVFRRADRTGDAVPADDAGRYRSPEFATPWRVVADGRDLRVEHLPDDLFAPVCPGVYTSRATTLRFSADDTGGPRRMAIDTARASGFSFVRNSDIE